MSSRRKQSRPQALHMDLSPAVDGTASNELNNSIIESEVLEEEVGGDVHVCGQCCGEFVALDDFVKHKKECNTDKRVVLFVEDNEQQHGNDSTASNHGSGPTTPDDGSLATPDNGDGPADLVPAPASTANTASPNNQVGNDIEMNGGGASSHQQQHLEGSKKREKSKAEDAARRQRLLSEEKSGENGLTAMEVDTLPAASQASRGGKSKSSRLPLTNVALENMNSTRVAVAQFPPPQEMTGHLPVMPSSVLPPSHQEVAAIQDQLFSLQQAQLQQLQLIQQIQQQLVNLVGRQHAMTLSSAHHLQANPAQQPRSISPPEEDLSLLDPAMEMSQPGVGRSGNLLAASNYALQQQLTAFEILQQQAAVYNTAASLNTASGTPLLQVPSPAPSGSSNRKGKLPNIMAPYDNKIREEDPFFKHKCRFCYKVFGSDSALQIHVRSHTGERPYKCNICGNRFSTKGNLKVHFQRHSDKYPEVRMDTRPYPPSPKSHLPSTKMGSEEGSKLSTDLSPSPSLDLGLSPVHSTASSPSMPLAMASSPMVPPPGSDGTATATATREEEPEMEKSDNGGEAGEKIKQEQRFLDSENKEAAASEKRVHQEDRESPESSGGGSGPYYPPYSHGMPYMDFTDYSSLIPKSNGASLPYYNFLDSLGWGGGAPHPSETSKLQQLVENIEQKITDPNQCVYCHRVLSCKSALQMHYRIHTGERPYKCNICNRAFTTKGNMKTHYSIHRAKQSARVLHSCPLCDKKFSNVMVLQQHMRAHGEQAHLQALKKDLSTEMIPPTSPSEDNKAPEGAKADENGEASAAASGQPSPAAEEKRELPEGIHPPLPPLPPPLPPSMRASKLPMPFSSSAALSGLENQVRSMSNAIMATTKTTDVLSNGLHHHGEAMPMLLPGEATATSSPSVDSIGMPPSLGSLQSELEESARPLSAVGSPSETGPLTIDERQGAADKQLALDLTATKLHHDSPLSTLSPSSGNSRKSGSGAGPGTNTTCNICGKAFACNSALEIHYRSHTKERPFKCNVCHKGFSTRGNLKQHMMTHKMRDLPSQLFDASLQLAPRPPTAMNPDLFGAIGGVPPSAAAPKRPYLAVEEGGASSPGLAPKRLAPIRHQCNICQKQFQSDSALQIHMRTHTGEKPYKCNLCDRSFTTKGNMKVHMGTHYWTDNNSSHHGSIHSLSGSGGMEGMVPPLISPKEGEIFRQEFLNHRAMDGSFFQYPNHMPNGLTSKANDFFFHQNAISQLAAHIPENLLASTKKEVGFSSEENKV